MATKHNGNKGKFNTVVKELIIGFGFLNGLWYAVGTSPETAILGFINRYINLMPTILQKIVLAIPIILIGLTILTIITIYRKGGVLGSLAIIMAFIAGAIVLKNWQAAASLLLVSIVTGLITFKN
jgi:hypothetical protein